MRFLISLGFLGFLAFLLTFSSLVQAEVVPASPSLLHTDAVLTERFPVAVGQVPLPIGLSEWLAKRLQHPTSKPEKHLVLEIGFPGPMGDCGGLGIAIFAGHAPYSATLDSPGLSNLHDPHKIGAAGFYSCPLASGNVMVYSYELDSVFLKLSSERNTWISAGKMPITFVLIRDPKEIRPANSAQVPITRVFMKLK